MSARSERRVAMRGPRARVAALSLPFLLGAAPAGAAPNLVGTTGLVKIPTAYALAEGDLVLGFSWLGGSRGVLFRPQTNRMYYASLGLLPGVEVGLDLLQVIGWVDPLASGVAWAIHRMSHAKWVLPLPVTWPRLAVGVQDPLSVNGLARGAIGQTDYGLTTLYGVASQPWGPATFHLGYGQSRDGLRGIFGGADLEVPGGLNLRVEHDSREWSVGADLHPWPWLRVYGARLFPDDWGYGTAVTWSL